MMIIVSFMEFVLHSLTVTTSNMISRIRTDIAMYVGAKRIRNYFAICWIIASFILNFLHFIFHKKRLLQLFDLINR
jgi:hypothetical protein